MWSVCCFFHAVAFHMKGHRLLLMLGLQKEFHHVFWTNCSCLHLRIWGYRKWVIWREFSRELRTWPRPPWLTSKKETDTTQQGETSIPLASMDQFGRTISSEGHERCSRRAGFFFLCTESYLWCQKDAFMCLLVPTWQCTELQRQSWIFTIKAISMLRFIHKTQSRMQLTSWWQLSCWLELTSSKTRTSISFWNLVTFHFSLVACEDVTFAWISAFMGFLLITELQMD